MLLVGSACLRLAWSLGGRAYRASRAGDLVTGRRGAKGGGSFGHPRSKPPANSSPAADPARPAGDRWTERGVHCSWGNFRIGVPKVSFVESSEGRDMRAALDTFPVRGRGAWKGVLFSQSGLESHTLNRRSGWPVSADTGRARLRPAIRRSSSFRLLAAIASLVVVVPSFSNARAAEGGVTLYFLGNEGYALECRGKTVLVDALQTLGAREKGDLTQPVYEQMLARRPPFMTVALVLVSHDHADHFVPSVAAAFLAKHPETLLASTADVLKRLRAQPEAGKIEPRLREIQTRRGEVVSFSPADIKVEVMDLAHLAPQMYPIRVVAHLIEFGGLRILHLGDGELNDEELAPFHLASRPIDVAILPYWVFLHEGAKERVARLLGARQIVAMRLPAGDTAAAQNRIRKVFPNAIILTRPLEARRL